MDIYLFVAHDTTDTSSMPWVCDAWDEYSIDGNEDGYINALKAARKKHPDWDIREAVVKVPEDFLKSIYYVLSVEADVSNQPYNEDPTP